MNKMKDSWPVIRKQDTTALQRNLLFPPSGFGISLKKMETAFFLGISVTTYKSTWCDDPEHHNLNNLCSRYNIIEWFTQ